VEKINSLKAKGKSKEKEDRKKRKSQGRGVSSIPETFSRKGKEERKSAEIGAGKLGE